MKLQLKPVFASFAVLTLLFAPALSRADGLLQNGDTAHPITLFAASTSDGQTGVTGLVLTLTISKNGGAFAAPTGTVAEIGGGYYKYTPSAADDGTDGELIVNAAATGAYINPERRRIIAVNPDDLNLALPLLGTINAQTTSTARQADMTTALGTQGYTPARAAKLDNADAPVSSRLATSGYTAPATFPSDYQQRGAAVTLPSTAPTGYGGSAAPTDYLSSAEQAALAKLDATISSRLAASGYVAPANPTDYAKSTAAPTWYAAPPAFPSTVSLSSADEAQLVKIGLDSSGVTLLLGRPAQTGDTYSLVSPLITSGKFTAAALSNVPASSAGAIGPATLSSADEAKLTLASTAQQAGQPVTLPSSVLSQADLTAVQQAVMTYALHTGLSFQRAMAEVYLASAAPVTPAKSGAVSTNPFSWPDGTTGQTSTINSITGARTESPGTLPN